MTVLAKGSNCADLIQWEDTASFKSHFFPDLCCAYLGGLYIEYVLFNGVAEIPAIGDVGHIWYKLDDIILPS